MESIGYIALGIWLAIAVNLTIKSIRRKKEKPLNLIAEFQAIIKRHDLNYIIYSKRDRTKSPIIQQAEDIITGKRRKSND